jgi:hypothetical protein
VPEVFVRYPGSLDDLTVELRRLLNVPPQNQQRHHVGQRRDSLNRGGTYYLLETGGFDLHVMENRGDAAVSDREDWPYYIELRPTRGRWTEVWANWAAEHVADELRAGGLQIEVG